MKKYAAIFLSLLLIFLLFSSCKEQEEPTCRQILDILTETEIALPAGKYYSITAKEGDSEFLSDSLLGAIYGGSSSNIREGWIDCALYLSFLENPCEFAIIRCSNKDYANDTAKLLCARLSAIKSSTPEKYSKMVEEARVSVMGNYALLIISSDSQAALKVFKKALRSPLEKLDNEIYYSPDRPRQSSVKKNGAGHSENLCTYPENKSFGF